MAEVALPPHEPLDPQMIHFAATSSPPPHLGHLLLTVALAPPAAMHRSWEKCRRHLARRMQPSFVAMWNEAQALAGSEGDVWVPIVFDERRLSRQQPRS